MKALGPFSATSGASKSDRALATVETLRAAGLLDEAAARRVAQVASSSGESPVSVVHQLALADDQSVIETLAKTSGLTLARETELPTSPITINGVSIAFLRTRRLLPLGWKGDDLLIGVIDPSCSDDLAAISFAAGRAAAPRLMTVAAQKRAFDTLYGLIADDEAEEDNRAIASVWTEDTQRVRDQSSAGPAVRIVDALRERALDAHASDIHIEPLPDRVRVRLRIDGALETVREEPIQLAASIAARIKVLANMNIADKRSAQDGRTSLAAKGRPVDVRISSVPSAYGETIALRLLRREHHLLNLDTLGFCDQVLSILHHVLGLRRGLFLITGPTGSGKTTTLYAMLERMRDAALKILSIEDPIEYFFPDITQVQVNEDAGLTFPTALRSFLRQDPDVILVGEIRDAETARIAVQAALTGHLVLATLHTTDAPGAVSRLVDLGLDRYLIAATLLGTVSQRLVRRLCPSCSARRAPQEIERQRFACLIDADTLEIGEAPGCPACRQTGISGRLAIGEGFLVDSAVRDAVSDVSGERLHQAIEAQGFAPLPVAAARMAASGRISPLEIDALGLA